VAIAVVTNQSLNLTDGPYKSTKKETQPTIYKLMKE
jgi:hypothetical protein